MGRFTNEDAVQIDALDRIYVNGEWVRPASDRLITVVNPATEQPYFQVADANGADVALAARSARDAFDNGPWPRLSPDERAVYLQKFAHELERHTVDVGKIWSGEIGVTLPIADLFLSLVPRFFNYYADLAATFPFEEAHPGADPSAFNLLVREPVGVVAAIVPWNAPMSLIAVKLAPALLAGCTVVLKASPEAPGEAYLFAHVAHEIGIPPGVINVVCADREASELLVRDQLVDKVSFTGSNLAGKKVAAICGDRLARCTLELGGKSPAIILDDYDIETAANTLAMAGSIATGQVCSGLTRVIVSRGRHDAFVDALGTAFSKIRVGDPSKIETQMGPLAAGRHRDRVEEYFRIGEQEGARVVTGGKRPPHLNRGFFVEPTVFDRVDPTFRIAQEEIFGPVITVISADDEDHAAKIADSTQFGLNASVFTNDADRAYAIGRKLRSGTVGQNGLKGDFLISFGGFKQSGIGREGGREGLLSFLESKTMIFDKKPGHIA